MASPMFLYAVEFLDAHGRHLGCERYLLVGQVHDQVLERARQASLGSDLAKDCRAIEIRLLDSWDPAEVTLGWSQMHDGEAGG